MEGEKGNVPFWNAEAYLAHGHCGNSANPGKLLSAILNTALSGEHFQLGGRLWQLRLAQHTNVGTAQGAGRLLWVLERGQELVNCPLL